MNRYRLSPDSKAHPHPEGELIQYSEHAKEVERLRALLSKSSAYARQWRLYATSKANRTLAELHAERLRSDKKYGPARERGYTPQDWLAVLMEEVGEVARALTKNQGRNHLIDELIQVAGVAMAAAEALSEISEE